MNGTEKELKEKIIRTMAGMAISDNTYTISQAKKVLNETAKELCARKKKTKQKADENSNE